MKFGIATFPTDYSIPPAELAIALEERGFESMWVAEHSHIPADRTSPWPGGDELPKMYYDVMDPFVVLSAAAAVTTTLRIGTGICLVVQRDPLQTAKAVASLDQISGGRFLFGIGAGWNAEEMAHHGVDPARRTATMLEHVEAMRAIWTADEAEFHGRHVDFSPIWSWPKPTRVPPVLIGGGGPTVLDRVLSHGDGWIPLRVPLDGLDAFAARVAELRGRATRPVSVTLYGAVPKPAAIESYAAAGVDRLLFELTDPGPGAADASLRELDTLAGLRP